MQLTKGKKRILEAARGAFAQQTGVAIELVEKGAEQETFLKIPGVDADLQVVVDEGGAQNIPAALIFRKWLQNPERYVVALPQVTANRADQFRQDGIQFIDAAGNGYIDQPPVYLFVKGNKARNILETSATPRVFKQTGLRVLYAFLCQPGLENETYRTIADKTDVALGMVNRVVRDLEELGFLATMGTTGRARNLRLIEKEHLLNRWVTAYAEQLRPKLVLGRYDGVEGWWQQATLKPDKALWGGEVAAAKLTNYLKPLTVTVYVDRDDPAALLIPNRLKKNPQGDVELVARFWQPETIPPNGDMVHPLLVYADLLATGNQRNIETAKMIYDRHLLQLVREN
ncbi:type IV toxin-antitoxin system AbiEi family antitoxin [Desulfuromonas carbonis]|uniref:type IV toxin-antitoxin system AbiEi family antitoxin n=1 Tax=Desulfuromonas sp. DDH964 TaxID=1823759 RepID=UPI00078E97BF|nr:type IV toxin-antitoxin system AbiEi family antitoxin [Desulfuromonas sp. DDH964]AMV71130.1 hypothetical protein DBW_0746 [Desulfuromonas sp. DDH964]